MESKAEQKFIAQVAQFSEEITYAGAWISMRMFNVGELAARILPNLRGGQLFAYLFRRFGYPSFGWDGSRRLVNYCITTPIKDVFLMVFPDMSYDMFPGCEASYDSTPLMFGHYIDRAIEKVNHQCVSKGGDDAWYQHELYQQCQQAFEVALRDLTRPVFVRDIAINCYGRVADKDLKKLPEAVKPSHMAGYPIPSELFAAIETLGNGCFERGIETVLNAAAEKTQAIEDEFQRIVSVLEEGERHDGAATPSSE